MDIKELKKVSSFTTKDNNIYINLSFFAAFYNTLSRQAIMYMNEKDKIINMIIGTDGVFEALSSLLENKIEKYNVYIYDSYDILRKHDIDISEFISDLYIKLSPIIFSIKLFPFLFSIFTSLNISLLNK